jgi:hypothetical protein
MDECGWESTPHNDADQTEREQAHRYIHRTTWFDVSQGRYQRAPSIIFDESAAANLVYRNRRWEQDEWNVRPRGPLDRNTSTVILHIGCPQKRGGRTVKDRCGIRSPESGNAGVRLADAPLGLAPAATESAIRCWGGVRGTRKTGLGGRKFTITFGEHSSDEPDRVAQLLAPGASVHVS